MNLDIQSVSCARRRGCSCEDYFRRLREVRKTYEEKLCPALLVVKKASKMRSRIAVGTPGPVSSNDSLTFIFAAALPSKSGFISQG